MTTPRKTSESRQPRADSKIAPRRRLRLWATAVAMSVIAGLLLFAYYFPFRMFNDHVRQRMTQLSGEHIEFEDAYFSAAKRMFYIRNMRLGKSGDYRVEEVELLVSLKALLSGGEGALRRVTLNRPSRVEMNLSADGPAFREPLAFATRYLKDSPRPEAAKLDGLVIRDASLRLTFGQETSQSQLLAGLSEGMARELQVGRVTLHLLRNESQQTIEFAADVLGRDRPMALSGSLTQTTKSDWNVRIKSNTVDLSNISPSFVGTLGESMLNADFSMGDDGPRMLGSFTTSDLTVASIATPRNSLRDGNIVATFDTSFSTATRALRARSFQLTSDGVAANVSGNFQQNSDFNARIEIARIGPSYQAHLQKVLPRGYELIWERDSLQTDLTLSVAAGKPNQVIGRATGKSIRVRTPYRPEGVMLDKGELNFEPQRVLVRDVGLRVGDLGIRLDGEFTGNLADAPTGELSLQWNAAARGDAVAQLLNPKARPRTPRKESGTVESSGTLVTKLDLSRLAETKPPKIQGSITLNDLTLAVPQMKEPLTDLSGSLRVSNNRVATNRLSGNIGRTAVEITGALEGNQLFWRDPVLTASIATTLDIQQSLQMLPPEARARIAEFRPAGTVIGRFDIATPLADLDQAQFSGRATLSDVSATINAPWIDGPIIGINGDLALRGSTVEITDISAIINGNRVNASGTISPRAITVRAETRADASLIMRVMPRVAKTMEFSGPVGVDIKATFNEEGTDPAGTSEDGPPDVATTLQSLSNLPQRVARSIAEKRYTLEGFATPDGMRFRHKAMPMARKVEGRDVPQAQVSNIRGRVQISDLTVRATPRDQLRADFANVRNVAVTGELEFRPGSYPRLNAQLDCPGTVYLDPWLFGWGEQLRQERIAATGSDKPLPVDPESVGKILNISGRCTGTSSAYKGIAGGPVSFDLKHTFSPGRTRLTEITNVSLSGLGEPPSRLTGRATIDSAPQYAGVPRWNIETQMMRMRMLPLLIFVFSNVENIDGRITGTLRVEGRGTDTRRIRGEGNAAMSDVTISRTPLVERLTRRTRVSFQNRQFETASTAGFVIGDNRITTRRIDLQSQGISMRVAGSYGFDGTLDADLQIGFIKSLLDNLGGGVPIVGNIIGELAGVVDQVTGALLLGFRVRGTAANPQVDPVPLPVLDRLQ